MKRYASNLDPFAALFPVPILASPISLLGRRSSSAVGDALPNCIPVAG